ncbi:MAG: transcriptional repressor [Rhodobacteraceae bacterium]|nr:MAG: transcriptional repressor [Paracoccaceae bacterium]
MVHTPQSRAKDWLSSKEVRPTRQRLLLATLLVGDGQNRHVTAESLYEAASDAKNSVSLATVYNTLRIFCEAKLVNEVKIDGNKSFFDTRTDHHPHFYWEDEGRLTDAPRDELLFECIPTAPEGMEISRVDVVFRVRKAR